MIIERWSACRLNVVTTSLFGKHVLSLPSSPLLVLRKKTTAVVNFEKKLIKAECLVLNGYKTLFEAISVLSD